MIQSRSPCLLKYIDFRVTFHWIVHLYIVILSHWVPHCNWYSCKISVNQTCYFQVCGLFWFFSPLSFTLNWTSLCFHLMSFVPNVLRLIPNGLVSPICFLNISCQSVLLSLWQSNSFCVWSSRFKLAQCYMIMHNKSNHKMLMSH